jgi:class 3 adenylate cyclase/tetratricopeptide (TPR) repeat protein
MSNENETLLDLKSILQRKASFEQLLAVWQRHEAATWRSDNEVYRLLAEQFIKHGDLLLGLDVLSAALTQDPQDIRFRQLQALALAGTGATALAFKVLSELGGDNSEETLGIRARTYKDLWRTTGNSAYLEQACRIYQTAFEMSTKADPPNHAGALYSGINSATLLFLLDRTERAREIAREVRPHCLAQLELGPDFWAKATLGEAALVLGEIDAAARHYTDAAREAESNLRELASARRQAREILTKAFGPKRRNELDSCFGIGPVLAFSGHMVDTPGRQPERFPERNVPEVAAAIRRELERWLPSRVYSSAASGSDILLLEALKNGGRRVPACVVLPYAIAEFVKTSVAPAGGDWTRRFDEVIEWVRKTGRIELSSETPLVAHNASYGYCNIVLQGLAGIEAARIDSEVVGLAVWDGKAGDGPGGTSSVVARWHQAGIQTECISPTGVALSHYETPAEQATDGGVRIVSMLFADVEHYSQMSEAQIPQFRDHFLTTIAEVIQTTEEPDLKNTWGDGLYFVFENVRKAAFFALELQKAIKEKNWEKFGLPANLTLRIALHAGPVYECINPITGRADYLGTHINRAARIEPKTARGQIYCSQQFVALVHAHGVGDFVFEYVGRIELPKNSGVIPLYNVRTRAAL